MVSVVCGSSDGPNGGQSCPDKDSWDNLLLGRGVSTQFKGVHKWFPWPAWTEAILPVLVVRMQLDLNSLFDQQGWYWPTSSPIVTHTPLVSPVHLDSYITSYPFARGSLIALMMEAVRTSATLVNIYLTTWQYIPEDSKLHTRLRENLKSHGRHCLWRKGRHFLGRELTSCFYCMDCL
jgi:hypothetical protein